MKEILKFNIEKLKRAVKLIETLLNKLKPFPLKGSYTSDELEPYDALSGRFIRAVEVCIKTFRSYEFYMFGEVSQTFRDLLNNMAKLDIISDIDLWFEMRNVRNRIVHDYLPEKIKEIYDDIMFKYSKELIKVKEKFENILNNIK